MYVLLDQIRGYEKEMRPPILLFRSDITVYPVSQRKYAETN